MDTVTVNGKEYIKATVLAKKFKYTTDYVGQLCRKNKVEAELVGRSWYVNLDSLEKHKKSRYKKVRENDKIAKEDSKITKTRINVNPVITNRATKFAKEKSKNFINRIDWKPVKYEIDESDLLPKLDNKKINIDLADAVSVKVNGFSQDETTDFSSEDLPEVLMKGPVKISSEDHDFIENDHNKADFIVENNKSIEKEKITSNNSTLTPNAVKEKQLVHKKNYLLKLFSFLVLLLLFLLLLAILFFDFSISVTDDSLTKKTIFSFDFFNKLKIILGR
ncbi:MAG: hypothetical protein R3B60_00025 [Candidatus Paceibacterota bacterium]